MQFLRRKLVLTTVKSFGGGRAELLTNESNITNFALLFEITCLTLTLLQRQSVDSSLILYIGSRRI